MTGFELIKALRSLPYESLEQPVIFDRLTHRSISDEYEMESVIIDSVEPFSSAEDMNGNYIKLS